MGARVRLQQSKGRASIQCNPLLDGRQQRARKRPAAGQSVMDGRLLEPERASLGGDAAAFLPRLETPEAELQRSATPSSTVFTLAAPAISATAIALEFIDREPQATARIVAPLQTSRPRLDARDLHQPVLPLAT